MFVHDQREKYTNLDLFRPENFMILNNTVTSFTIRPEIVEKLSTAEEPCSVDENYSHTRVSGGKNYRKDVHGSTIAGGLSWDGSYYCSPPPLSFCCFLIFLWGKNRDVNFTD